MELAILCDQKICLVIFDESKNKIVNYNSQEFDIGLAKEKLELYKTGKLSEIYDNSNYDLFKVNQTISNAHHQTFS